MKAWNEDTKCSIEEKSDFVVNLVKHITTMTNGKVTSMIAVFNIIPTTLHNVVLGKKSKSMTSSFLLTSEIFEMNVHDCLVDSSASFNLMSYVVSKKINAKLKKTNT